MSLFITAKSKNKRILKVLIKLFTKLMPFEPFFELKLTQRIRYLNKNNIVVGVPFLSRVLNNTSITHVHKFKYT